MNSFRELVEANLQELSKDTLKSYIKKASDTRFNHGVGVGIATNNPDGVAKLVKTSKKDYNRRRGINTAVNKLAETQLDEITAESNIEEGDVNYAKMHTQANPKYASGTKWRKSSAAVKAKPDDVGAGELGAHGGGSGHVAVKATMNQRDKLADRQEINARGHKAFAIKQTRAPRSNTRRPLPEGLTPMSKTFVELVESQLNEISRNLASSYISGAKSDERKDRSAGVKLAQKKKWGDSKFGFEEPKVKATSEEVVSESILGHYHSVAEEAIDNATGFSPPHPEYHKWMTVHHKAMRAHYERQGNRRLAESHDRAAEHHADNVDDEDFHNGESHHWNGF